MGIRRELLVTAGRAALWPVHSQEVARRNAMVASTALTQRRRELIADYRDQFANPFVAAERGYVDDVIEPRRTRPVLIDALETTLTKREPRPRRKHGNIPL